MTIAIPQDLQPGDVVRWVSDDIPSLGLARGELYTVRSLDFGGDPIFTHERADETIGCTRSDVKLVRRAGALVPGSVESLALDPSDPFEARVVRMVELNRRKRADYALDGDPWSNFRQTAELYGGGMTPADAARFNICQKIVRLRALRENDRAPQNEAVTDTADDLAVYSIILGILLDEMEQERGSDAPQ